MLKKVIFISLFIVSLSAQTLFLSGGLTSNYGDGIQPGVGEGDTLRNPYYYREHLIDLNGSYGNFSIWTNLEFSSPPQIGSSQFGLRKFRLTWQKNNLTFQVGDLYGQVGNGLGLNMWESQGIDWDSTLKGVWFTYNKFNSFSIDLLSGISRTTNYLPIGTTGVDPRKWDYIIESRVNSIVFTKHNLFTGLNLGTYAINVISENPWFTKSSNFSGEILSLDSTTVESQSLIKGIFSEYIGDYFSFLFEYTGRNHELFDADKLYSFGDSDTIYYDQNSKGRGYYGSCSFYPGRLGVTFEFKDYLFDASNPDIRVYSPFRLHRRSVTQSPPTVFKEHSGVLLSRIPHVTDFEDEIGFQVEINLELTNNLFLVWNYAHSNRHSYFYYQNNYFDSVFKEWIRVNNSKNYLSQFFEDFSGFYPFTEKYFELNYYFNPLNLDLKSSFSIINDIEPGSYESYYEFYPLDQIPTEKFAEHWTSLSYRTIPSQLSFSLYGDWGFTVYVENQWETESKFTFLANKNSELDTIETNKMNIREFYYRYVSLNISKRSKFSLGLVYDWTPKLKSGAHYNSDPKNDSWLEEIIREQFKMNLTNKWFGVQGTYYFTPSTILSAFYGSIQGGLKCDSGVCVYVPGIEDALMLTLTSSF